VTVVYCETGLAQGPLKKKLDAARRGAAAGKQSENDSNDKRNDVEGTIWEFKVIDRKEKDVSKQTKMTGKLRMKQTSVFSVGDVLMVGEQENKQKAKSDSSDVKGQLEGLLSQRMKKAKQKDTGGDRVGDFSKKSNEYIIRFDEDDDYPLSGRAELRLDQKNKGGVWFGKYVEYLSGNKKQSWRIEMRRIED
jgi:hypothetical protein